MRKIAMKDEKNEGKEINIQESLKAQEEAKNDLLELASIGVDEFATKVIKKSKKKHENKTS